MYRPLLPLFAILLISVGLFAQPGTDCPSAVVATQGYYTAPSAPYWYTYTASTDEDISITSVGLTPENTVVRVYSDCVGTLTGENDDFAGEQSQLQLSLTNGQTINILWDNDHSSAAFDWRITTYPQGEDCTFPFVITNGIHSAPGPDLWWSYTATQHGLVTISDLEAGLTTYPYVYDDCNGTFIESSSNSVFFEVDLDQTIFIYWYDWAGPDPFDFEITIEDIFPGDLCTEPLLITEGIHTMSSTETPFWYSYTATQDGLVTISPDQNQYIELYRDCNYQDGRSGEISLDVSNGEIIQIAMWDSGPYDFELSIADIMPGDLCTDPIVVSEGVHSSGGAPEWYEYTASQDGLVTIEAFSIFDSHMALYRGCGNYQSERDNIEFIDVINGETIQIYWLGYDSNDPFDFEISIADFAPGDVCNNPVVLAPGVYTVPRLPFWYSYTASSDERIMLSSEAFTSQTTRVYAYNDCIGSYFDNEYSTMILPVLTGETIYFEWRHVGSIPSFDFEFSTQPLQTGDQCEDPVVISEGIHTAPYAPFWYSFTAPTDGQYQVASTGLTEVDTYVYAYGDCFGSLYAQNNNWESDQSYVLLDLLENQERLIKWGADESTDGFNWIIEKVVDGDICQLAFPAALGLNATFSEDEWVTYTATQDGIMTISSVGTTTDDTYLEISFDCGLDELSMNDDFSGTQSQLSFQAYNGQVVYIHWMNNSAATGFAWNLLEDSFGPGDSCNDPVTAIEGLNSTPYGNYWFQYTATADGMVDVSSAGQTAVDTYAVIIRECGNSAASQNDDYLGTTQSRTRIDVTNGETIYIHWLDNHSIVGFDWILTMDIIQPGDNCQNPEIISEGIHTSPYGPYWYSYTASQDGLVTINALAPEGAYPYMYIYDNCSQEDAQYQTLFYPMLLGETIQIEWYEWDYYSSFDWELSIADFQPGDRCDDPIVAIEGVNTSPQAPAWFSYTASQDGMVTVSSVGQTSVNTEVEMYRQCGGGNEIRNDNTKGTLQSEISFPVEIGEEVFIYWSPDNSYDGFDWTLEINDFMAGDRCSDPILALEGSNSTNGAPVWYYYTGPQDGLVTITPDGSTNTRLMRYDGCDNYIENEYNGPMTFPIFLGETVQLFWDDNYNTTPFDFNLAIVDFQPGDDCSVAVEALEGVVNAPNAPYWYFFTATDIGEYTFTSVGLTSVNTYLRVYEDCDGTLIEQSNNYSGNQSQVTVPMGIGEMVYILWDDNYSTDGFDWEISFVAAVPGEICQLPVPVVLGINSAPQSPFWYEYTAGLEDELITISSIGLTSENTRLYLYSDCSSGELINNNDFQSPTIPWSQQSQITWHLAPEETILIYWSYSHGPFDFNFSAELAIQGESCQFPIEAVEGINTATEAPQWFTYTASQDGIVTISSLGLTDVDTYLEIHYGCDGYQDLNNNNSDGTLQSYARLQVEMGETFQILWADYYSADGFDWTLEIADFEPGDICALPEVIDVGIHTTPTTPYWYSYTATQDGLVTITSEGHSNQTTYAYVWSECTSTIAGNNWTVRLPVESGQEIQINWVEWYGPDPFDWELTIQDLQPGDQCTDPVVLGEDGIYHTPYVPFWFSYTATSDVLATFNARETTNIYTYINVYSDCSTSIDGNNYGTSVPVLTGETVYANWIPNSGSFDWEFSTMPLQPGDQCTDPVVITEGIHSAPYAPFWYSFTAPSDGQYQVSTLGFTMEDTYVRIYNNCSGSQLASNNNFNSQQSFLLIDLVQDQDILIFWDNQYSMAPFDWIIEQVGDGDICQLPYLAELGTNTNSNGDNWYEFTSDQAGILTASSIGLTSADTRVELYYDCGDEWIGFNEGLGDIQGEISIETFDGQFLYIRWINNDSDNGFDWDLSIRDFGPGDTCDDPVTAELGTNLAIKAPYWYTYTTEQAGILTISSVGMTDVDTDLIVYDVCGGSWLDDNDDFSGDQSEVSFEVSDAMPLIIHWTDENSVSGFEWELTIADFTIGDTCEDPLIAVTGENVSNKSISWYSYTMPQSGNLIITSVGYTDDNTRLEVYFNCGSLWTSNQNYVNGQSQVIVNRSEGAELLFRWESFSSSEFSWYVEVDQPEDYFWVGNGGNWSDLTHWATTSGGVTNQETLPYQTDNVIFDQNSFGLAGETVVIDFTPYVASMDWTNVTNNPILNSNRSMFFYGSVLLSENMDFETTSWLYLYGNNSEFEFRGDIDGWNGRVRKNGNAHYDLLGNLNLTRLELYYGSFNTNSNVITLSEYLYVQQNALNLGNSELNLGGFLILGGGDLLQENPQIFIEGHPTENGRYLDAYGYFLPNVTFNKSGRILADMSIGVLEATPGTDLVLLNGGTFNIDQLNLIGSVDKPITLQSDNAGYQTTIFKEEGTVDVDFLDIMDINATGGATFNATHSHDLGNNSGWIFGCPDLIVIDAYVSAEETCEGADDVEVTIEASGSPGTYMYSMDGGETYQSSNIFTNQTPGEYDVYVEDEYGCFVTTSITMDGAIDLTWYQDFDVDGFGNPDVSQVACTQPTGYVLNALDCDDTDNSVLEIPTWYIDLDGDGYGSPDVSLYECYPAGSWSLTSDDCNDFDALVNPATTWYQDSDLDGFGNPGVFINTCFRPDGYVLDNTDCNDASASEYPDALWYRDQDGDGLGSNTPFISCLAIPGYVSNNLDCDDNDDSGNFQKTWYADADGDGYGDVNSSILSCTQPSGYILNIQDCDDSDAAINPEGTDTIATGIDGNCDGLYLWYADLDGDGFAGTSTVSSSNSTPGIGEGDQTLDCDDTDPEINPETEWYADSDGDGYGDPENIQTGCSAPSGYIADASDCNDSNANISPDATDVPGSGIDANCDGDYVWFIDKDGDGYAGTLTVFSPNTTPGQGQYAAATDCDDNNYDVNPGIKWYADTDADGFGDPTNFQLGCDAPTGFIADNTDCNDTDVDIYPGAPGKADGLDNNCDGSIDKGVQVITFDTPDDLNDGSGLTLSATSDSGLEITYTVSGPATVSGSTLTSTGPGMVMVTASQSGNDMYSAAESVIRTFCINPDPAITVVGEGVEALTISSNYSSGNQWYWNGDPIGGAQSQTYIVTAGGSYVVEVTSDGCVGTSDILEAVLTNVDDLVNSEEMRIYPVPVSDLLNVEFEATGELLTLYIIDMAGKVRITQKFEPFKGIQNREIDVSELPQGQYAILMKRSQKIYISKFVKQ